MIGSMFGRGLPHGLRASRSIFPRATIFPRENISFHARRAMSDWAPVESRKKSATGPVLALLCLMPIISFALGTWQVKRLKWKQELIATAEVRLALPPLPLPPSINPQVTSEFDFRKVSATGEFDHAQEMLVGPRVRDGKTGFLVVTPLVRKNGTKLLICRGWIDEKFKDKRSRPNSLIRGPVKVDCLLRDTPKKNNFTPDSQPQLGLYHFMDINEMARRTGSQPIYFQQLENPHEQLMPEQLAMQGIPLGVPPKVEFRNTHFQYILTWYGLSILTAVMLVMVWKQRRASGISDPLKAKVAHARKWQ